MKKLEDMPWWNKLAEIKDDFSLRELADIFDATPGAINNALKRNGIVRKPAPPGPRSRRPDRSEEIVALRETLGITLSEKTKSKSKTKSKTKAPKAKAPKAKAPKAKAAKDASAGKKGARGPRAATAAKLGPYEHQLGTVADAVIAEEAGVSVQTVARYRKQKGIKPSRKRGTIAVAQSAEAAPVEAAPVEAAPVEAAAVEAAPAPKRRGKRSKIEKFHDLVGQVPDAEVAELAGLGLQSVRNYRKKNNIAAPPKASKAAPAPVVIDELEVVEEAAPAPVAVVAAPAAPAAPAPAATAVVGGTRLAYRVSLGDRTVIVVASDVVDAATQAYASGESVGIIELMGEVLG